MNGIKKKALRKNKSRCSEPISKICWNFFEAICSGMEGNMKYAELVKQGQLKLFKAGINDYDFDAWVLVEKICGISRTEYFVKMHDEVSMEAADRYFQAIDKRITHYPLQYIVGEWEFMGLTFKVNEHVLIPRQDTEVLVEKAVSVIESEFTNYKGNINVMDMCTGSGCIGISVAKNVNHTHVTCVDVSKEALEVAKENAQNNKVKNISFVQSDLFTNVSGKYNVIISNPPYITSSEIEKLMPEVKDYEPRIALDGDKDGLKFYRLIIERSKEYLEEKGFILFEIGYDQGKQVKELLKQKGFADIEVLKDLSGNDRVVMGKRRQMYV